MYDQTPHLPNAGDQTRALHMLSKHYTTELTCGHYKYEIIINKDGISNTYKYGPQAAKPKYSEVRTKGKARRATQLEKRVLNFVSKGTR